MAFDINNKISQIKKDLERLEAELDSFNRANYDGSENSNIRKKQKQIKEKQLELLKYRNVKAMQQKDTMEILRLSGFMVDGYKMEDPKTIEKKIKEVKASGHPDPYYLSALQRALSIAKQERGMKDGDIILPQHEAKDASDLTGKNVWVRSKGHEWRVYVLQDKGDKLYIRDPYNGTQGWIHRSAITGLAGTGKDEDVSPKFKKVMEEFGKGELESSSGEKVTDPKQAKAIAYSEAGEAKDGGPGSGIKGHTTPENEKPSDYDEKEIEKIKAKWKGKESVGGHGSEYGDILNHLEQKATKAGTLPDMDEYFKLNDKLIDLRQSGKKDTEEYKSVEKQRNDFNKKYNKAHKALKEKARSLSSESEQKRLGELDKMVKGAKDDDATKEGAIKEYGKEKGSFEDDCGEKVFTKGTEDAERSVTWVKPSEINYKIGDIIQFKGKNVKVTKITGNVVEAQVMDACSNKDADPKVKECNEILKLSGFFTLIKDAEEGWITMNGAHVKIEEGQSKGEAAGKFIAKKKESKLASEKSSKKKLPENERGEPSEVAAKVNQWEKENKAKGPASEETMKEIRQKFKKGSTFTYKGNKAEIIGITKNKIQWFYHDKDGGLYIPTIHPNGFLKMVEENKESSN